MLDISFVHTVCGRIPRGRNAGEDSTEESPKKKGSILPIYAKSFSASQLAFVPFTLCFFIVSTYFS